jgi:hypothetical protein
MFLPHTSHSQTSPSSSSSVENSRGYHSHRKRKNARNTEISNEEWETIRSFQATKIETKTGIDGDIDQLRLLLNKITDKTFKDIRSKFIEKLDDIYENNKNDEPETFRSSCSKIAAIIYDISSTNKFYSKLFSDLFCELADKYEFIRQEFLSRFATIHQEYNTIVYIDPDEDYDAYCINNKLNERRRSLSAFLVHLARREFIEKQSIENILNTLVCRVERDLHNADNKNTNDELVENIAILFNSDLFTNNDKDTSSFYNRIHSLSLLKSRDCKGLSNKSIFKCMDIVDA